MSFSFLAILCKGAFLLLITGRMGIPGLCKFNSAFNAGGDGFYLYQVFDLSLVDNYE
jgi:hypothetical protein